MKTKYALEGKTKTGKWEGVSFADHETIKQAEAETDRLRERSSCSGFDKIRIVKIEETRTLLYY